MKQQYYRFDLIDFIYCV